MTISMTGYNATLVRAPWRIPLRAYLRALRISDDGRPEDRSVIKRTQDVLLEIPDGVPRTYLPRPDLRFSTQERGPIGTILVCDAMTGDRLGGAFRGLPVVFDGWKGLGIGAEIVCFSDLDGGFGLNPCRYSESGFRARVSAHRRHVERALRWCPEDIPDDVIRDYTVSGGGSVSLASPWGRAEHEEWIRRLSCR
jgi:hypothetical protein